MYEAVTKPKKASKTEDFKIYGAFKVRISDNKSKRALIYSVKSDAVHARNMILILRNKLYEESVKDNQLKPVLAAFSSKTTLRDTVFGRNGNKQADKITLIREHFKGDELFEALCTFCQLQLDAKSVLSILTKIHGEYGQFFTNIAKYVSNPGAYVKIMGNSGAPRPPKAKKIKSIVNASLLLDGEKWSFRIIDGSHYVKIKIAHRNSVLVPVNWSNFNVPAGMKVRSLNVNISNDDVYLDFTYGKVVESIQSKNAKKWAGGDVGMINLMSVFVKDKTTPSLLICGRAHKYANVLFIKEKAELDKAIAVEATQFKTVSRKNKEGVEEISTIAIEHSELGEDLKSHRRYLTEKRTRYFDTEFNKLSKRLVKHLLHKSVTDFVMSKNLSFLKTSDTQHLKLNSKVKQAFYHLPLGRFINIVAQKCDIVGIDVQFINEVYTSKTSCLFANVNDMAERARTKNKSLTTNDCLGGRVKRGLFKDHVEKVEMHADINGDVTHIKAKICNPIRIKSDYSFCAKTACEVRVLKICASGHKTKQLIAA